MNNLRVGLILLVCTCVGCGKKDPAPKPVEPVVVTPAPSPAPGTGKNGSVAIEFMNRVGADELTFNRAYKLNTGDSVTITKFNYYISNISFRTKDGGVFIQPESYFVVRHPATRSLTVPAVPSGTYTSVRFLIGVDSTRNCSGAQTGGLDLTINGDMFWSWNSGYIFMKVEGHSPQSGSSNKTLTYHIGGFKGIYKAQRFVDINLGSTPLVINDNSALVKIGVDIDKIFKGSSVIDPATLYNIMSPGEGAKKFADNYSGMCTLESVQN